MVRNVLITSFKIPLRTHVFQSNYHLLRLRITHSSNLLRNPGRRIALVLSTKRIAFSSPHNIADIKYSLHTTRINLDSTCTNSPLIYFSRTLIEDFPITIFLPSGSHNVHLFIIISLYTAAANLTSNSITSHFPFNTLNRSIVFTDV